MKCYFKPNMQYDVYQNGVKVLEDCPGWWLNRQSEVPVSGLHAQVRMEDVYAHIVREPVPCM